MSKIKEIHALLKSLPEDGEHMIRFVRARLDKSVSQIEKEYKDDVLGRQEANKRLQLTKQRIVGDIGGMPEKDKQDIMVALAGNKATTKAGKEEVKNG